MRSHLSNGEFVVNARSAAQNRALLEQINQRAEEAAREARAAIDQAETAIDEIKRRHIE